MPRSALSRRSPVYDPLDTALSLAFRDGSASGFDDERSESLAYAERAIARAVEAFTTPLRRP